MSTRIKMLYLIDGISPLDSRKSLSVGGQGGGSTPVESIRRVATGFQVGYRKKLYFVPDSRVEAAEIEDPEAKPEEAPAPESAPTPEPAPQELAGPAPEPVPGEIYMNDKGQYVRAPKPPVIDPAQPTSADPRHEEANKYVPRSRRKRPEA